MVKNKITSIWIYISTDQLVVFRGGGYQRDYHLRQHWATYLAFRFEAMQRRGTVMIYPHGHGYLVEPVEASDAS